MPKLSPISAKELMNYRKLTHTVPLDSSLREVLAIARTNFVPLLNARGIAFVSIKILETQGFKVVHQKGSHVRLRHPEGRRTTVPMHSGEDVGVGLLKKILRDANISRNDFDKLK